MLFQPSVYSEVGAADEGAPAPALTPEQIARRKKHKEAKAAAREKIEKRRVVLVPVAIGGGVLVLGLIAVFAFRGKRKAAVPAAAPAVASSPG